MDVTLESLGIDELLKIEMEKVMKNMNDINTNPSEKREINIKLIIIPKTHNQLSIQPAVKSKLAGIQTKPIGYYYDKSGQLYIDDPEQLTIENVRRMKDKEA